jgi:hypothetical protein
MRGLQLRAALVLILLTLVITISAAAPLSKASAPQPGSLDGAAETAQYGSIALRLKVSLWRDFMPVVIAEGASSADAPSGRPMVAVIQLNAENTAPFPPTLKLECVTLVQGDQVWETKVFEINRDVSGGSLYEFTVREGPRWQPKSFVDVIVRLVDVGGSRVVLTARHQIINMSV